MRFKKLTLILSSAIALTACNSGTGSVETNSSEQKKSEEMVPNPRILGNSSKSLLAGDSTPAFIMANAGVQIGDGYDPDTKKVVKVSINDGSFAYLNEGVAKSPIIRPACYQQDYAKELGGMSSSSSNQIFGASINGAANVGLYKAALAGSFNKENATSNNQLGISKIFGAAVSCNIDTIVAPKQVSEKGTDAYEQMGEALINSSGMIAKRIKNIRNSKTLLDRQKEIAAFYENYGTYMVSGVKTGQIALKQLTMTQQNSATEGQTSAGVAASFSSPFASLEGSANFASAEKFTSAGWNIELSQYLIPNTTPLKIHLTDMQDEFNKMTEKGIIDFSNLKPDLAKIDPAQITMPKIPPAEINTVAREKLRELQMGYNEIKALIPLTEKEINTGKPESAISSYTKIITNLTTIEKDVSFINENINYLSTSDYNEYSTKYSPKAREWKSGALLEKYQSLLLLEQAKSESKSSQVLQSTGSKALTPQQIKNQIKKIINSGESAVTSAETEAQNKQVQDKAQDDVIKEFGVTYSSYEEKAFVKKFEKSTPLDTKWEKQYNSGSATASNKSEIFRTWKAARIVASPTDTLNAIKQFKQDWKAKFNPAPGVPLYVTKAEADEYEKEMHTNEQPRMLQGAGNDDPSLYGADNVVMDFSVTPWAKIFPELANTMAVDDSIEDNELTVVKAIREYTRIHQYLKAMSSLDGKLSTLRSASEGTYNTMLELERLIQAAIEGTETSIKFKGETYSLSDQDGSQKLFNKISTLISSSPLVQEEWYKVTKKLYDNGLIGGFGSFLGFKPEDKKVTDMVGTTNFGLLTGSFDPLKTVDDMNKDPQGYSYNSSGYRIYLDSLVKQRNGANGTETTTDDELPQGIFTTNRLRNQKDLAYHSLFNTEYQSTYLFNSGKNPIGQLALKDLPRGNDAKSVNLSGVIPAVLSYSKLEADGNITKIGLLDSGGHIIGANPHQKENLKYADDTVKYNLYLTHPLGDEFTPAYALALTEGTGLVTEVDLTTRNEYGARDNKILLGQGYAPNISHIFEGEYMQVGGAPVECIYDGPNSMGYYNYCWSEHQRDNFNPLETRMTFSVYYGMVKKDNLYSKETYRTYVYNIEGAKNVSFSKYVSKDPSRVLGIGNSHNGELDDQLRLSVISTDLYWNGISPPEWKSGDGLWGIMNFSDLQGFENIQWNNKRDEISGAVVAFGDRYIGLDAGLERKYLDKAPGFSYADKRYRTAPYFQHKLLLVPINKSVIKEMKNEIEHTNSQPLIPTYNY
jgi:hypothetical protein